MRTLAIETASEACSIALFEGERTLAHDHRVLGRGHAEALVPMISGLPHKGLAERIVVSLGPGSFTGVRIGIATARALGFAWGAQVWGYPTLALVAAHIAQDDKMSCPRTVTVCMNGGHGEWFVQNFRDGRPEDTARSLAPEAARDACRHDTIIGNRADDLANLLTGKTALPLLPDAALVPLLHEDCLKADLSPIYGRAPDATPQKVSAS